MAAPLVFGGITRLQRTSSVTPSSGVTFARTKSGPIVNSGFGRAARKTCASAAPGTARSRSPVIQARIISICSSGRPRLRQAAPVNLGLDVADSIPVELDLDLVMLDVPAVHRREPSEPPAPVRHDAPATVDEGAAAGRAETLAFLRVGTAEAEHLSVRGLARLDARERLARDDGARLALGRRAAPRPEADPPLEPRPESLDDR